MCKKKIIEFNQAICDIIIQLLIYKLHTLKQKKQHMKIVYEIQKLMKQWWRRNKINYVNHKIVLPLTHRFIKGFYCCFSLSFFNSFVQHAKSSRKSRQQVLSTAVVFISLRKCRKEAHIDGRPQHSGAMLINVSLSI